MLKTLQKKLKNVRTKLYGQTKICKICFKPIKTYDLLNIFCKNPIICKECRKQFKPKFIHFYIEKIECISLYNYDENIRSLLYQFKGCYDIELSDVFLYPYLWYLRLKFSGYFLLPAPSWELDDLKREFNHVNQIFQSLKLPILNIVKKKEQFKQSDLSSDERSKINENLLVTDLSQIKNRKILIVDDIFTTGSTVKAMIEIAKKGRAKKVKVLTIAKTQYEKRKQ